MTLHKFAVALLASALVSGAAFAQTAQPTTPRTSVNTTTATLPAGHLDMKATWRASKLVGLSVYNEANEKLGDISEILVDHSGKVAAVVIGVGGFLGMGEHDIAVTMDKLKFVERGARTDATTATRTTGAPAGTTTTTAGTTSATGTTSTTGTATMARNDWVPERAVMNATKDQLKAIPQFKYSDYN